MNFALTDEQAMMKRTVRDFAEKEIAPRIAYYEETEEFPADIFAKMGELGLLGIFVPEAYGGLGGGNVSWAIMMEEIARVYAAVGANLLAHSHAERALLKGGSEDQKHRYLSLMASGKRLGQFAITEPQAGSDAAAITTRAVRDGDQYVLNGAKCFASNWGAAELYYVAAKTDPTRGNKGVSIFIVEKGTPGFHFGAKAHKMGMGGAPTGDLVFEDCRVPATNLLGAEGEGFKTTMRAFSEERCGNAALSLGNAQGAYEYTLRYLKERVAFGQPLARFQGIQWMLADMAIQLDAARLMIYRAAWMADQGMVQVKEVAMAKVLANEAAMRITTDCVQLLGGHGYMKDHPVERMMREAKLWAIGGGTTQIQRNIIAQHILQ